MRDWLSAMVLAVSVGGCAPPAAAPPAAAGPAVKLSAGVALAQTGPEGTMMMFSIDYKFLDGAPSKEATYAWVIQPAKGEPLEQMVKLKKRDTLQAIVPQWKPENGPFTSHLDEIGSEGARRPLCEPLRLR